ncbi:bifunctional 3,4-dihydroxy-2-butanone 4-phosphate synthase/GTP cyclohydrolase II [uncultured Campylobacter sp.]|uniref:bifunctional 3,4-dihydroxy-2-butanone 4-phosphate synthase/GTP cyclohydrolase II n=1 Tax=uncultured Campylobacter sp. TaxID=218934 RepID=UPI00261F0909|nr:bifunctional 3,4-dihydroxy-2-butanone 4-phosphate synthase/GTP cyclohydrolase II [uncultured Campylobacter sp.]
MISVEQAIEDLKNGKMLVMVDDVDRENEGDLVFASTFSSAQKVNFAITHARGVLCVALSPQIAQQLDLNLMVDKNTSSHETAFTVTIDAKGAKTGVSAYERNMTIELMSRVGARADDFVRPGHIFPLIAKSGGVLARTGHTEGSTDLCRLAGLSQSAVICEIVKDDGDMARRDDLEKFCAQHDINMISVAQIVQYRLKHETLVKFSELCDSALCGEAAKFYDVSDHEGNEHRAYIFGEPEKSAQTNVKFHKISSDLEFLSDMKFNDFMRDLDVLRNEGGVLLMLKSAQNRADFKSFGIGAQILAHLGVRKIKILSKSEPKDYAGLSGFGIDIV